MEFPSITVSPIDRLHDDLFLYIFNMNAHMFIDDKALITSRITSQVCHSWRELMLGSSLLWGRLVDFDTIAQYKVEALLADELIRRSGSTSAIWIKAETALAHNSPRPQLKELFLRILAENWHRTQILAVDLCWTELESNLCHGFFDTISLPATYLVSFDFKAGASTDDTPYNAISGEFEQSLFAGKAPCLRKFKAQLHKFDLRAPWIHHLSDLYIDHSFSFSNTLDALVAATNLQFLEIREVQVHQIQDGIQNLRRVNLPKLRKLQLAVDVITCIALLDRLKTPPTCALSYNAPALLKTADVVEDVFMPLVRRLAKFAQRFFKNCFPEQVVKLHREYGVLAIANKPGDDHVGFFVYLQRSDKLDFPVDAVKTFFSHFSLPRFSKTVHLWLELSADTPSQVWQPFLDRFPSVQVMMMSIRDIGDFKIFAGILLQTGVLPSLKVIQLWPGENFDPIHLKLHEKEVIAFFKTMRIMTGRPVQIGFFGH